MTAQLDISAHSSWLSPNNNPVLIAGPCSAETEEQLLTTAREIHAQTPISILRAGIWKPRTRPNSFEGVGTKGLAWLKNAGNELKVPVITEVANAKHVEEALKAEIDMLWIGARTTVNPFYVQEIAEALKGVDIPVFVKNPINPELNLWIGALERLNAVGITKLAAIHRGFSSFEKSAYRNAPMWEIPIALKAKFPQLPIICDPSHISGKPDFLAEVSQHAFDLNFDGVMIETHCDPQSALSDPEQQVTPHELSAIWSSLNPRSAGSKNLDYQNHLEELRKKIDLLDKELLEKFAQRLEYVKQIGEYKHQNNVAILQIDRWQEILETRAAWSYKLGLDTDILKGLFELIHNESISIQTEVFEENGKK